jgi:hypothetical protein
MQAEPEQGPLKSVASAHIPKRAITLTHVGQVGHHLDHIRLCVHMVVIGCRALFNTNGVLEPRLPMMVVVPTYASQLHVGSLVCRNHFSNAISGNKPQDRPTFFRAAISFPMDAPTIIPTRVHRPHFL